MYKKGKHTQLLKNTQMNQNEQTQIGVTGRFYSQKQQSQTRPTKARKTSQTPPKQTAVTK